MKHLSMDVVRVTEAAAIAASAWIGTGDKESADKAASEAMRGRLNRLHFHGRVVIGEGIKDGSYGLFAGEEVGMFAGCVDPIGRPLSRPTEICVDPIEGTRPTVTSGPEALSVIGIAEPGTMFATEDFYALKLAFGPRVKLDPEIRISLPLEQIVHKAAWALGKPIDHFVVCILDRPRHKEMIADLRGIGCRIKLIQDCDVSGALASCLPESGVDMLYGIGGAPEAVITACAMRCLGGEIQVQVLDADLKPRGDCCEYLDTQDLVAGDCVFAATGITTGSLLKGVRYAQRGPVTHSVFMRSASHTVRWLQTEHGN